MTTFTNPHERIEQLMVERDACRVHDVDEKAWLSKRVTELEAQLEAVKQWCDGACPLFDEPQLETSSVTSNAKTVCAYEDHLFAGPVNFDDAPCMKCGTLWSALNRADVKNG